MRTALALLTMLTALAIPAISQAGVHGVPSGGGGNRPDCVDAIVGATFTTASGQTTTCTFAYTGDYWA